MIATTRTVKKINADFASRNILGCGRLVVFQDAAGKERGVWAAAACLACQTVCLYSKFIFSKIPCDALYVYVGDCENRGLCCAVVDDYENNLEYGPFINDSDSDCDVNCGIRIECCGKKHASCSSTLHK